MGEDPLTRVGNGLRLKPSLFSFSDMENCDFFKKKIPSLTGTQF